MKMKARDCKSYAELTKFASQNGFMGAWAMHAFNKMKQTQVTYLFLDNLMKVKNV